MNYIISEEQNDRLKRIIFHVLDSYLTPIGGWEPEKYVRQLEVPLNDYELFIFLEVSKDTDDDHIFYSMCENPNYNYKGKGDCPEVRIPNKIYELLDDSFGNIWIPAFIEWFEHHSSLPVIHVDTIE